MQDRTEGSVRTSLGELKAIERARQAEAQAAIQRAADAQVAIQQRAAQARQRAEQRKAFEAQQAEQQRAQERLHQERLKPITISDDCLHNALCQK